MFAAIEIYIKDCISNFNAISEERKKTLSAISKFVSKKIQQNEKAELIYICTHNSRRSHFGQVWGKISSQYYGFKNVNTFSGGTEATAFNANAVAALEQAGIQISKTGQASNPLYNLKYDEKENQISCFSKIFNDSSNPQENFCAIMTCTDADENCPFVPGAELRIACPYEDPKKYDNSIQQNEKYAERCRQIATENLYLFSLIKI